MIEKIKLGKGNCHACNEVLQSVKKMKEQEGKNGISVAEIGVDIGATACSILEILDEYDKYYMFDFEETVEELKRDFEKMPMVKAKIFACGNSRKTLDSYNWTLQKLYVSIGKVPVFDIVYLDGAHSFCHDGLAVCILERMIKRGGFLILDDMKWSYRKSPTVNPVINPVTAEMYTDEQIDCAQVSIVADVFLDNNPNWKKISTIGKDRSVYQRTQQ